MFHLACQDKKMPSEHGTGQFKKDDKMILSQPN